MTGHIIRAAAAAALIFAMVWLLAWPAIWLWDAYLPQERPFTPIMWGAAGVLGYLARAIAAAVVGYLARTISQKGGAAATMPDSPESGGAKRKSF